MTETDGMTYFYSQNISRDLKIRAWPGLIIPLQKVWCQPSQSYNQSPEQSLQFIIVLYLFLLLLVLVAKGEG
jgi:hypothetical protein